jgi:hypothetical protein
VGHDKNFETGGGSFTFSTAFYNGPPHPLYFMTLRREENWRKTFKARERINKQLYSYMTPSLGIKPRPHW